MSFFLMHYAEDDEYEPFGVAYGPEDMGLFVTPPSGCEVASWNPLELILRDGNFADYLSNNLGLRLCSEGLKATIDSLRADIDRVQWLPMNVSNSIETRRYYVLHFPRDYQVLDPKKTITAGAMVVKPVLMASAVVGRVVFTLPNETGRRLIVSQELRDAILAAQHTGVGFTKVPMSN